MSTALSFLRCCRSPRGFVLALLVAAAPLARFSLADTFSVTETSWGSATTAGTLAWAIDQANTSSAAGNVISIAPSLLIDVDGATAIDAALNLAQFTRSVTIQGNGAKLVGNPTFVTSGGQTVTKYNPDAFVSGDIPVTPSFSFAKVGTFGQNNSGITVSIAGLNADGLNRFALVEAGARLDVTTAGIVNSVNFDFSGRNITPGFEALDGATLNLDRVVIDKAYGLTAIPGGIVAGSDATINVSSSTIRDSNSGPAIILAGGTANVVSSVLDGSGGVTVTGGSSVATGTVNFVNSVAFLAGPLNGGSNDSYVDNRFAAGVGGTINATASTIIADLVSMDGSPSAADGVPLDAAGGTISLRSSAVMVTVDADGLAGQIGYRTSAGGVLAADPYSWVRPTLAQTASLLPSIFNQPSLITGSPGLLVDVISPSPLIEMTPPFPLASRPVANGVLIGVVPDADGANVLINPIDGSAITVDVFGDPRTTDGLRNAGAVESAVPEVDPASAAGALSLLFGMLACLEERRRLRR
jgi:hypothetical protein